MQTGFAQHRLDGQRLFEHTVLANRKAERAVYTSNYKKFRKMGLDKLDQKFDNKFRVDSFDPTEEEREEEEGIVATDDLKASQNMQQRALKRAYGQEIIERMENKDRISDKQKAFLVKDFIENNGAATVATLFLKMHGFRSWKDLFDQAGVSQEEVQEHYIDGEDQVMIGFGDVDINDDLDKTFMQKHGKTVVRGAILTGVTVATGGAGLVASAAGMVGGAIGRRVARYFAHDRHVQGRAGEEPEKRKKGEKRHKRVEDLSQMSRGMEMVTSIIDDYMAVRDNIRARVEENRELRLAKQTEETADTQREHFGFPKEVMDLEDGKNLLGLVMKGFSDKARENIGKDERVGKYWANEKVSKRWELFGGIVGGVIGGGAGAALHAKMESYRLLEQIHNGQGVSLDLDGDKIEHTVRMLQNPASGHADYMWQMGTQDVARVGHESVTGWTHSFMTQNGFDVHVLQGGSFDAAALNSLSPDQITVHATALNIPEATLMQSLFMKALLSNALTVGGLTATAVLLDNLHYQVTGKESTKNRDLATTTVGRYVEYSSQRRRADRQEKLDKQLTPDSAEAKAKKREEDEKQKVRENFTTKYVEGDPAFKTAWQKIAGWEGRKDQPVVFLDVESFAANDVRAVNYLADKLKVEFDDAHVIPGGGIRPAQVVLCVNNPDHLIVPGNPALDTTEKVLQYLKDRMTTATYDESTLDQLVIIQKGHNDSYPDVSAMSNELKSIVAEQGSSGANIHVKNVI
ncbi:hypothetical protein BH11PAT4_BH11PAT4_2780 [soil metagenome]